MRKVVIATEALRREIKRSGKDLTLTIVPIVSSGTERCDYENVFEVRSGFGGYLCLREGRLAIGRRLTTCPTKQLSRNHFNEPQAPG
jgi:hypothetical protein